MKNSDFEISLDSVSCNENQSKTPEEIENDRLLKVFMKKLMKLKKN